MIIREIKRHLNKPDEAYRCHLLHRAPGYMVVSYATQRNYRVGQVKIAKGSVTHGHYWTDRGYVLWTIYDADGELAGHLFHICRGVKIGKDWVEYVDLLLDLWFYPDGTMVVLDEDELMECRERGVIEDRDWEWIATQRREIVAHGAALIEETMSPRRGRSNG